MTLVELRYYFEHEVLPKYFFEDSEPFLSDILEVNYEEENSDENKKWIGSADSLFVLKLSFKNFLIDSLSCLILY